jgi:hypothetical protein
MLPSSSLNSFHGMSELTNSHRLLPQIMGEANIDIDVSLLDVLDVEGFMTILKTKLVKQNISSQLLRTLELLARQLKISRSLLTMHSQLLTRKCEFIDIKKVIGLTSSLINAESVAIMHYNKEEHSATVIFSNDKSLIGSTFLLMDKLEGNNSFYATLSFLNKKKYDLICIYFYS